MNFAMGQIMSQGLSQLAAGIERTTREVIELGQTYAQQVEDMARLSGATVEDASRIIQVADDMRLSYEDVSTALKMYAKTQEDAGGVAKMSIDELANLSDQYLKLGPGVQRANFLLENFGRAGLSMGKLMEQGGEKIRDMAGAVDDSLIMTQEGIDQAEEYRRAMDDWNDAIMGVKLQFAQALTPTLKDFTKWATTSLIPALKQIVEWFKLLPAPARYTIIALGGFLILAVKLGPALLGIVGIVNMLAGGGAAAGGAAAGGGLLGGLAAAFVAVGAPVILLTFLLGVLLGVIIVFGKDAWAVFKGLVSLWLNIVVGSFKRMVYEIKVWLNRWIADFKVAVKFFTDIGKSWVDGIWKGIQGAWATLKTNVSTALDALLKWIQDKIKAHSPSLVFATQVGRPMAEGIGLGFNQALNDQVKQAMTIGIEGLTLAGASQAQSISVGQLVVDSRLSQQERNYWDDRAERIAERSTLRWLKKARLP